MTNTCFQFAIKYISRYPKTQKELTIKLFQKWFSSDEVNNTISKLKDLWYVDDQKFTQSYINSELINKWKPPIIIKQKLIQKWIDPDIVQDILDQNSQDILQWIHKKINKEIQIYKKKSIEGFEIIQKLIKKWYKLDDIKTVIHQNNS